MNGVPRHVAVVVPACNEEQHIGACLTSVSAAIGALRQEYPSITCEVVVVLDRCTDGTDSVASAHGACTVRSDAGRVGSARRIGTLRAHRHVRLTGIADGDVWLANTDADTEVPDTWLTHQVGFAAAGVDMVVGTVSPKDLDPGRDTHWRRNHVLVEGHSHVHGANLGLRLSVYLAAGGFADVAVHEDLDIVTRVRAVTPRWVATHRTSVTTSAARSPASTVDSPPTSPDSARGTPRAPRDVSAFLTASR